jgi:hypothetical protein
MVRKAPLATLLDPVSAERLVRRIRSANLVVLTAHKDEAFRTYVRALGLAGAYRNRVIAILSCYDASDEAFNSKVLAESGAKAIIYVRAKIREAGTVSRVLIELDKELDDGLIGIHPLPLKQLLRRCVEKARREAGDELNENQKQDLELIENAVIQVSDLRPAIPPRARQTG